jgi:hypothetical protein
MYFKIQHEKEFHYILKIIKQKEVREEMIMMKNTSSNIDSFLNVNKMDPFIGIRPTDTENKK